MKKVSLGWQRQLHSSASPVSPESTLGSMLFSEAALEACSHFQISHSQECIRSHTYSVMYTYLYMYACIHMCAYLQTKINTQPRVNLLSISIHRSLPSLSDSIYPLYPSLYPLIPPFTYNIYPLSSISPPIHLSLSLYYL